MNYVMPASAVLSEIADERARQDAKWGEQNHPDGTGTWVAFDVPLTRHEPVMGDVAQEMRRRCQEAAFEGRVTWRDILLEEVFEGLAEHDQAKLRAELIQVAAVAVNWVEAIDRRAKGGEG